MQFRWAVDLGQSLFVTTVRITDRADCCWANLTNFNIRVTEANLTDNDEHNPQCGATYTDNVGAGQTLSVNCAPPLLGQIVTVSITEAEGTLSFCEVEVYGYQRKSNENLVRTTQQKIILLFENRMQQCCAAHIVHSCQQYCSALLHLITG